MPTRSPVIRIATTFLGLVYAAALVACGSSGGAAAPTASQAAAEPVASTGEQAAPAAPSGTSAAAPSEPDSSSDAPTAAAEPAPDGQGGEADCPISAADISEITGLTWEFQQFQAARPLESDETITTTVCAFTADESVDEYGDPAFLRTDEITGADVAQQQATYAANCSEFGGELTTGPVSGGVYCTRNGLIVDGQVGGGDRLVEVLVNGGGQTAEQVNAVFDQLLAAVD